MKRLGLLLLLLPALALAIYDTEWYDLNNWLCPFYNDGRWGIDVSRPPGLAGGSWPQPLLNEYIFGAGPWVGSIAGGDTLVTMGYYPNSGGTEMMPTLCRYWREGAGNSLDRIYRYPGDWPPPRSRFPMAPQASRSEMDLWCCFGDSAPFNHYADWSGSDVVVVGDYAYVAGEAGGLRVLDVSVPQSPAEVGFCDTTQGTAYGVAAAGTYVYLADGWTGLRIVNVYDPRNPFETGHFDSPGMAMDVAVVGSYAYVADHNRGLRVINVYDPQNPYEAGFCETPGYAYGVAVAGDYAYVADDTAGLRVIDVSNPQSPHEAGHCNTPGRCRGVAVSGSYAYVADGSSGLRIISIANPLDPREVGSVDTQGWSSGVAVVGRYVYVADGSVLRVVDVYTPQSPHEEGSVELPASAVAVSGSNAFVAGLGGLRVVSVSNPQSPYQVGCYETQGRPLGIDICLTVYSYSDSTARDVFVVRYELANHSGAPLNRLYFGLMLDGDVGDATDDMTGLMLDKLFHVGPDTFRVRNTGYVYDNNNYETPGRDWESGTPGAVAVRLLQAPPGLGLSAFKRFKLDSLPLTDHDQYLALAGHDFQTGEYHPYDSTDAIPGDKCALLSSGPFDLQPDFIVTFYYAVIGSPYGGPNQPPGNRDTTELGLRCWWAERVFQRVIAVEEPAGPSAHGLRLMAGPNPFSPSHPLRIQAPGKGILTAEVFDAGGRLVQSLAGTGNLTWNGRDQRGRMLPTGLYFVQAKAGSESVTYKTLLQH